MEEGHRHMQECLKNQIQLEETTPITLTAINLITLTVAEDTE